MKRRNVRERRAALERGEQPTAAREGATKVIRPGLIETTRDDPENGDRRRGEQADEALHPEPEEPRPEHRQRDSERDRASAVRAQPVVGHHNEPEDAEEDEPDDAEPSAREERACEERCEQEGLDLVADPPEARVLRRA